MKFYRKYRTNIWSDSKLVQMCIKNHPKPRKSIYSFDELEERLKIKDPLLERIVDSIQSTLMFPFDLMYSIGIYYKNCKENTHVLDGGLKKGVWYDLDYRIMRCLFAELEDFIVNEKGLKTLEWEKKLVYDESCFVDKDSPRYGKPTQQALVAIEQEDIYNWWLNNKDYDEHGFVSLEADAKQYEETTEMLIRLIKIRSSLWT